MGGGFAVSIELDGGWLSQLNFMGGLPSLLNFMEGGCLNGTPWSVADVLHMSALAASESNLGLPGCSMMLIALALSFKPVTDFESKSITASGHGVGLGVELRRHCSPPLSSFYAFQWTGCIIPRDLGRGTDTFL